MRTALDSQKCCRYAGQQTLVNVQPGHRSQRRFTGPTRQQRVAQYKQFILAGQQGKVLLHGFAKPDAVVEHNSLSIDPQRL